MISLPAKLPFIRIGRTQLAAFEPDWINQTLRRAAKASAVPDWLAEDVAMGVLAFLREGFDGSVIALDDLFERIRKSLKAVGLGQVASELPTTPPPVRISLPDIARRAGDGYELMFFNLLEDRFQLAAVEGAHGIECYGMRGCVKQLTSVNRWSKRCERLQGEITQFLEHEYEKASAEQPKLRLAIH